MFDRMTFRQTVQRENLVRHEEQSRKIDSSVTSFHHEFSSVPCQVNILNLRGTTSVETVITSTAGILPNARL